MKYKKIEDILAECVEDIKSGRSNMADCLDRYPSLREQLEPLLKIAVNIQEPPDIRPSNEFKVRARVNLMEHIHARRTGRKLWAFGLVTRAKQVTYTGRLKVATVALVIVLSVCGLGGGLAYASQDSLPGDNLYPVKLSTEQFRRVFTVGDVAEAELELAFADTRLDELDAITKTESDAIAVAVNGYKRNITAAVEKAEETTNPAASAYVLEIMALATSKHLEILYTFEDASSEQGQVVIKQAQEIAFSTHVRALRDLAIVSPLRAAEINLVSIEGRLNRARAKADENEIDKAEAALSQFEELLKLGEEISQISKGLGYDTVAVDELNARATAAHLEVLGIIYGKAPEQTKEAVENAMGTSVEAHDQAVKGLQEKGAIDDIPEEPPIPDDIPEKVKERILKPDRKPSGGGSNGSGNGRR